MTAIFTKTIIRTPVVRWILQARIRERHLNDVVFVGDDFVHVKQVKQQGHLEHVATKTDFDGRIRAARTLDMETTAENEDVPMKTESGGLWYEDESTPRQCLVLTVDNNELLFLRLNKDSAGRYCFVHHVCPLPVFDRTLFQPGEHLAVDPYSRALAVAANEREVVIYATRLDGEAADGFGSSKRMNSLVSAQRPLQIEGVIQHMDFLTPPSDDEDHVILLFIIKDKLATRAIWMDWYVNSDLYHAQIRPGQPLHAFAEPSNLLVPLRDASFFLVHGSVVTRWTNILSGYASGSNVPLEEAPPLHPGATPRKPIWINWCRPRRSQEKNDEADHLYLIREDGLVYLLEVSNVILSSHAGNFGCHISTAFASLGDLSDPDILIGAGDMSSGRIYSIGHWATPIRVTDMNRTNTMLPDFVETIPNWASVTDMVVSSLPGKSQRARDGVFVTSGRQPFGAITELRYGLEARLASYFQDDGLQVVKDIWALPLVGLGHVLVILSTPLETRFLQMSPDVDVPSINEVEGSELALDSENPTITAEVLPDGRLVQVTRTNIRVSFGMSASFEDTVRIDRHNHSAILVAAVNARQGFVVTGERSNDSGGRYKLVVNGLRPGDQNSMDIDSDGAIASLALEDEPLCLALLTHDTSTIALVATSKASLVSFSIEQDRTGSTMRQIDSHRISTSSDGPSVCDNIVIIQNDSSDDSSSLSRLVVCGLRDGRLQLVGINPDGSFQHGKEILVEFGQSTVKLVQHPDDQSIAYAMSGLDTCVISWDGKSSSSIDIHSLWISDKLQPELAQGPVAACTRMPQAHLLASAALAGSLIMISDDQFLFTTVEGKPGPVPRQMGINGTPNRLIYAEQQRCLVCASLRYDSRAFPSGSPQSKPEERRQIWPVIDFFPSHSGESSFSHEMQPGERVYALLEWSFRSSDDKTYSFILVGGSYTKSSGSVRGRITFLQPVNRDWAIVDVTEARHTNFDSPVYALALMDEVTYIACVGKTVIVYRFSVDEVKWEQICAPFALLSPGVFITFENSFICISTAEDSFISLSLKEELSSRDSNSKFRYTLLPISHGPRADSLLSHHVMNVGRHPILATKHGQLLGLESVRSYSASERPSMRFEAKLSRSLTRLRPCNVRPRWKPLVPGTCLNQNPVTDRLTTRDLIGCAVDGTLVGIALIDDPTLSRRLSWLQRLCEWSEEVSPHSFQSPPYTVKELSNLQAEIAMPIGFGGEALSSNSTMILKTQRKRTEVEHLNGDLLVRLLEKGGRVTLQRMIRDTAARNDRVGEWTRQNLDDELEAVDGIIEILEKLNKAWL